MHTQRNERRPGRRFAAGVGAAAIGLSGLWAAAPAQAAEVSVDDVSLSWIMNAETGGGAYFGGCNFLSAGAAGDTGSSRVWAAGDGFWASQAGNVTIEKPDASGGWVQPTWATKCQNAAGQNVSPAAGSTTGNRVTFSAGTGSVDTATGEAQIAWDGDYTIVFYGGLTYWTASDPTLTVASDGTATLTATASGYGASMEDPGKWVELAPQVITLADLTGVQVDEDGFVSTPSYLGVEVEAAAGQVRTGSVWGAFPQSFVDYQALTGQSSYWYSSGGAADPKKVAGALDVRWDAQATEPVDPVDPVEPGPGEIPIDVTVPTVVVPEEPGEFVWTIEGGGASVSLGTATVRDEAFVASGVLPKVTIKDTRAGQPAWTVNGSVSDFAAGTQVFDGKHLGWGPALAGDNTVGASNGQVVVAGVGSGLKASSTLAYAPAGHPKGQTQAEAAIDLKLPIDTKAGDYTGVLTLTAIG